MTDTRKKVGQFYEKRGDDHLTVYTSEDKDVVQIVQRDSVSLTYPSINFWAESAPKLISLIQKAAGIKAEKVEYEYNIEHTDLITGRVWLYRETWEPKVDWLKTKVAERGDYDRKLLNAGGTLEYSRRLVKRVKAGEIETV